uniref:Tonsoku-like protein n=2 Tax=Lygus hesperus TaxID=30085 RepID=A0A0A9Z4Z7_LYGHE
MDYERWRKKKSKALKDGDLAQLIVCCKELAECNVFHEKYHDALEEYKEMERAAEAMHSEMDVARANRMIGEMYCEMGEFDKAISHQQRHLDIARNQNDKVEQQRALATLGRTYFMMADFVREGDYQKKTAALGEAKQYFTESLAMCEQLTDSMVGSKQRMEMRARLFLNLGLVHDDEGHVDSAIDYINKAVFICKKVDLWEDLFKAYIGLGCTYNKNGMKKDAISTFDKAVSVAERLSSKVVSLCEVLSHKAEALLDLPDFRGARQALLRAYKLNCPSSAMKKEIEKKLRIVAAMCETEVKLTDLAPEGQEAERKKLYESLGDMASELRNFEVALTYYTLMLQCVEKCGDDSKALIECYVSLAQTYKDAKQYKKAVEYFRKEVALEKGNHEESCKTYLNIAELYHLMGKDSNAMEAYKAAKSNAESCDNRRLMKTVLCNMVQHFKELCEFQEAEKIQREMNGLEFGESSDEEDDEDPDKSASGFGTHINLDDLSDPEMNSQDGEVNSKVSRTRAKPRSNIHKKNELGETPLHRAAITGNLALATKLLDQGHSVDVRDYSGWTPLHEAANHGFYEIVEILLKKGAAVNDRGGSECNGVTPLLDAASCGHFEIMDLLLQHKASPLMKNNDGCSILDLMSEWKMYAERQDGRLDDDTLAKYEAMYSRLQQILERAGYKSSQKRSDATTPVKGNPNLRRTTTRNVLYEEDDYDFNVRIPATEMDDEGSSYSSKSLTKNNHRGAGASEYESAMRAIRFRSKDHMGSSSLIVEPKIPALIPAGESVGDDWLEEDVVRPIKKRKTSEFLGEPQRRRKSDGSPRPHQSPKPSQLEALFPDSSNDEIDWSLVSDLTSSNSVNNLADKSSPSTSGTCSNKLKVMNLCRRKELPLTTGGLSQEKIGRSEFDIPPNEPRLVSSSSSMTCIRILVEGKLLLVPVPSNNDSLNMEWLADETAKRYKCLEGVEPKLRLLTSDGAILLNSDPVSLVLSMGELQGQVLSWNLPSLVGSYEEMCYNNSLSQDSSVIAIFEACPATSAADFSDTYLDSRHLMCALKILSHHHPLQSLNLSGNNISDRNLKELSENLVKLPQLRSLNLSTTNITTEGLTILSHTVNQHKGLQRLQTLDLGFNPLGDCLKALGDLISHLPALTSLIIPSVDLFTQSFRSHLDFTLDTLETINVSYNDIGTEGVIDLLGRLNPRTIQELVLSHTGGKTLREVGLYLQMNAPPCLRSLDLSYCPATEDDVRELIQGLEMCPHLERLSLEGVCGLGEKNVVDLMGCKNVRNLNLAGSLDIQQPLQVVEHLASLSITSCADQKWAFKGPYGFCTTTTI